MSSNKTVVTLGGSPIFIILLILKLTATVNWSWWIITLPLWLPMAIMLSILGVVGVFALIAVWLR